MPGGIMYVTVLDTQTGETKESTYDSTLFWWSEGNGGCDCNRVLLWGEELEAQQHQLTGTPEGHCLGAKRFLVVSAKGDLEGLTEEESVAMINGDYPEDLIVKHLRKG
jgi:hypothetical protein